MQTSTPIVNNNNIRRSVLLREITNSNPPHRRRGSNVINSSFINQEEVDDEIERSKRRNEADMQKRLSSISSPKSPQTITPTNEKEMRDHWQVCLKMYAENKISSKNAWNLKIIDYMRTVLHSQGLSKDSLQVASTSLDVSAKIYGIRVDDIHAEGLKLASNMARVNAQGNRDAAENDEENQGEGAAEDGDKENKGSKKKKKKRLLAGQKSTIVKDPQTLLGNVPKLESVFFQTRTNLEASPIDNLFTSKMPMNYAGYKYMLLSKEIAWPTYSRKDPAVDFEKSYPIKITEIEKFEICPLFADFEIDEWDPEQEALMLKEQDRDKTAQFENEVVYDSQGIPIPELDGSVHDLFADGDADNQYAVSDEEEHAVAQVIVTDRVAHIVDFRPDEQGVCADDYSYSASVNISGNKLITQIWAGPSHWKLKHIRRTQSKFSGVATAKQANKPRRIRYQPTLIDFNVDAPGIDMSKKFKAKRIKADDSVNKCTLPQVILIKSNILNALLLKPSLVYVSLEKLENQTVDPEVGPYNYENPNDSMYCSQKSIPDDNDAGEDFFADGNDDIDMEEEIAASQNNYVGTNLVNAPELVPKSYIQFAMHAKKMDMKKLKVGIWKSVVSKDKYEQIPDKNMYEREVLPKYFSEIYKELPARITEKMQQELTCPLAFAALLHLANEQNLYFDGKVDLTDFLIKQMKVFTA